MTHFGRLEKEEEELTKPNKICFIFIFFPRFIAIRCCAAKSVVESAIASTPPFLLVLGHNLVNNSLGTANRENWFIKNDRRLNVVVLADEITKVHIHSAQNIRLTQSLSAVVVVVEREARTEWKKQAESDGIEKLSHRLFLEWIFERENLNLVNSLSIATNWNYILSSVAFFFVCSSSIANRFVQSSFPIFVWHLFSR